MSGTTESGWSMAETKRGPDGETIGLDGPEPRSRTLWRWWTATAGIRFIVFAALFAAAAITLMAVVAR